MEIEENDIKNIEDSIIRGLEFIRKIADKWENIWGQCKETREEDMILPCFMTITGMVSQLLLDDKKAIELCSLDGFKKTMVNVEELSKIVNNEIIESMEKQFEDGDK